MGNPSSAVQRGYFLRVAVWPIICSLLFGGELNPAQGQILYSYTDLGALPGGSVSEATGINNNGDVVGNADDSVGHYHGFLYSDGLMSALGSLGGANSHAWAINDNGQIVGSSDTLSNGTHAVLYSAHAIQDLGGLPCSYNSSANAINAFGQIVGDSDLGFIGLYNHAFGYANGTATDLGTLTGGTMSNACNQPVPAGGYSVARAISYSGTIVGTASDAGETNYAFSYTTATGMKNLGAFPNAAAGYTPGYPISDANAVNTAGQIVGYSCRGDGSVHAFSYEATTGMQDLGVLPACTGSLATAINTAGKIVGQSFDLANNYTHAFVYYGGVMVDLNSVTTNSASTNMAGFGVLETATGINDLGQIVGSGTTAEGFSHAFLLTPITNPPAITAQPDSSTVTNGNPATFTVSAGGTAPLVYRWRRNGTNLVDGGNISGATSNTLALLTTTTNDAGSYRVVITNLYGSITSSAVILVVGVPPGIATQPVSVLLTNGASTNFTVVASGTPPLAYQWQRNGTNLISGGNISGSTTNKLSVSAVSTNDVGYYAVIVSNAYGGLTSSVVTLSLKLKPSVMMPPRSLTVTNGNPASFTVTVSGSLPLAYHWQRNSTNLVNAGNISGATNATLVLSTTTTNDASTYRVVITNLYGSVTSSAVTLTVGVPPSISTQPVSVLVSTGVSTNFSVTASGTSPLSYQWQRNRTNLFNSGDISGATTNRLSISSVSTNDAGSYAVIVSNAYGSITSSVVSLSLKTPPGISTQPLSLTVTNGNPASFTVAASGSLPLAYHWQRDSTNLIDGGNISGATNAALFLSATTTNDASTYRVIITNLYGSITSSAATLIVGLPPGLTQQPVSVLVNEGDSTNFMVVASGTAPLTFQWQRNGTNLSNGGNISGATTARLNISAAGTNDGGAYTVVVANAYGSIASSVATLNLRIPPSITTQPQSLSIASGAPASFTVAASGPGPLCYQWQRNNISLGDGGNISGAASAKLMFKSTSTNDTAGYSVIVTNMYGSVTSLTATLTVTLPPGFSVLHYFTNYPDGGQPLAGLTLVSNTLYGTTLQGGTNGNGIVYALNTDDNGYRILYQFSPLISTQGSGERAINADGASPQGALSCWSNTLFGTTSQGGLNANGTLFSLQLDGSDFAVRYSFSGPTQTWQAVTAPVGDLLSMNGLFYGATSSGYDSLGALYSFDPNGNNFSSLFAFSDIHANGTSPTGALIGQGNRLYGMTLGGASAEGNIYAVNADGSAFVQLVSFPPYFWNSAVFSYTNSSGYGPVGQLVTAGNKLFGLTGAGGTGGGGTLFSINSDGTGFAVLHAFSATGVGSTNIDGANPLTALLAVGATLFGSTSSGGTNGDGVIFSINTDGSAFTVLRYLNGPTDGYAPNKLLFFGNRLYGTTRGGGLYNYGTVFSLPVVPPAALISGTAVDSDGSLRIGFSGAPYSTNLIQTATNLVPPVVWQTVATNVADGNGQWQMTNSNLQRYSQRYYRALTP